MINLNGGKYDCHDWCTTERPCSHCDLCAEVEMANTRIRILENMHADVVADRERLRSLCREAAEVASGDDTSKRCREILSLMERAAGEEP